MLFVHLHSIVYLTSEGMSIFIVVGGYRGASATNSNYGYLNTMINNYIVYKKYINSSMKKNKHVRKNR